MKIYVAHTYGRRHGLGDIACEINTWKSIEVGRKLIEMGHNPFVPNLWHFIHKGWDNTQDEHIWLALVSEWVKYCDALLVAEMPPWENSGVQTEIDIARAYDLPVYYSIEEIPFKLNNKEGKK